jgi:Zn-dependent M28 family amino/carboxypeptidase
MNLQPKGQYHQRRFLVSSIIIILLLVALFIWTPRMPGKSYSGPFLPLTEEEERISSGLRTHVYTLAGEIGERNIWKKDKLYEAADYIENVWKKTGYSVQLQEYEAKGVNSANLEIEIPGAITPDEIVLVGAHYDSVIGSPGANDNGTGVAALLEIARLLVGKEMKRTVRLVAFSNEEPPFFLSQKMGSRVYANRSRQRRENIIAMLSLETMGYYSEAQDSQHYPFPFGLFYPHTANFIGFVGNIGSRHLVKHALASFRSHTEFPSEGTAAPGWLTGIGWSDHWSFWREGYHAIMVTDTALFRYDPYHTIYDTPEKIDYERLARVVDGIEKIIEDFANTASIK